ERFSSELSTRMRGISGAALRCMCKYAWPGNVRELINRMRRAIVMGEGNLMTAADLGLDDVEEGLSADELTLSAARMRAELAQIEIALAHNRHCVTSAARELGVSRVTLYRLMKKYSIDGGDSAPDGAGQDSPSTQG